MIEVKKMMHFLTIKIFFAIYSGYPQRMRLRDDYTEFTLSEFLFPKS